MKHVSMSHRPVRASPLAPASPATLRSSSQAAWTLPDEGKLLVVDDVVMMRRVSELQVVQHFPKYWQCTTVESPEEAIAIAAETRFDVIFMDELFSASGMRGTDAIARIRQHEAMQPRGPAAVIISCTADAALQQQAKDGALPSGVDAVWSKPAPSAANGSMQQQVAALLRRARGRDFDDGAPAASFRSDSSAGGGLGTGQTDEADDVYLQRSGVEAALHEAVASVLRARPSDPITAISAHLRDLGAL